MADRDCGEDAGPECREREAPSLPGDTSPSRGGRWRFGMKRCLSDKALMRLQAGDGSAEQRAHLSACGACGDRYRRGDRELETVRHVLLHTDEPSMLVVARRPSWVPGAAVAASRVTVGVWGHLAVRRPDAPASALRPLPDGRAHACPGPGPARPTAG